MKNGHTGLPVPVPSSFHPYFNSWCFRIAFRAYTSTSPARPSQMTPGVKPGLVSGGGSSSSRSWESLTSSIQRRSKSRSAGSGAEPRAETESQEHPESTSSCRPRSMVRKQMLERHLAPTPLFPPSPDAPPAYLAVGSEAT